MCTRPIVISYRSRLNRNSDGPAIYGPRHAVLVTCGKCEDCVRVYQNDWAVRSYFELLKHHKAIFFTLTYNQDSVPFSVDTFTGEIYLSVCKRDVQLFLKRFREYRRGLGKKTDWSYYVTSEYGPRTLRPHYHGLLFGVDYLDWLSFSADWKKKYGFIQSRQISSLDQKTALNSCRYVAKYCAKGEFENPLIKDSLVDKNFHLVSKGYGLNYLTDAKRNYHLALDFPGSRIRNGKYTDEYLEEIFRRSCVCIPPCVYHLPRYYREKIFAKRKDLQMAYSDYVCKKAIDDYEGKLAVIQTDKAFGDRYQASIVLANKIVADESQRAVDSRAKLVKSLNNSKL